MIISSFVLVENCGIRRKNEVVCFGVPLVQRMVDNVDDIHLKDQEHTLTIQKQVTQWWGDGSIRWLLIHFYANLQPREIKEYVICTDKSNEKRTLSTNISWRPSLHKQSFVSIAYRQTQYELSATIQDQKNHTHSIHLPLQQVSEDNICTTLFFQGVALKKYQIKLYLNIYYDSITCEVTLHNPQRAQHKNGLWDLDDTGTFLFRDFSINIKMSDICTIKTNLTSENLEKFVIYQDSSGGENWDSINHINRYKKITTSFRGYRINNNGQQISQGKRAQPTITLQHKEHVAHIMIENFWQNFPKAIACDKNNIQLRLFPQDCQHLFELQGGEQKTHIFHIVYDKELPTKKLRPQIPAAYYTKTKTIDFFTDTKTPVDDIIAKAVHGENSFIKRNERVDEYGWRNFGDFFADHEAINQKSMFISHYNNQYDLIYGFFLQYIRTGQSNWFDLMENLAQHVIDIDIYRTNHDKPAYNNGLFWHTNHYLPAQTATHRCYSHMHLDQVPFPKLYGGGPSNEHNYTTGLMHFYLATGNLQAKEAVLLLAEWVLNMEDGSQNIFRFIDKSDTGLSSQTYSPHYHGPGRGSANSINALLDAYSLTHEKKYIIAAEKLIARCITPHDNFDELRLSEPEERWSYTVFLQILGKYLSFKEQHNNYDEIYSHSVASLLHYAHWMVKNEYFYLDKPQKLEYPTETWAAQELRKVHVFFLAGQYKKNVQFTEKMHYFYHRALTTLEQQYPNRKNFVRPIAIMMHWGNIYHYATLHPMTKSFPKQNKSHMAKFVFTPQKVHVKYKIKRIGKILGLVLCGIMTILAVLIYYCS
ncbi:hypothetical protein [Candidatus Uabimicrobium amorphum]|uniref:PcRGLX/YetA-like N-terminal RIFT barrel domain-containing protein n=1 Tax=Uabimicrobium amorphum TaxID=2596890 RepID=A0A5S9F4Y5_UABAM|nr:hypothetical protein [Candidatus Uabimicrobium amorphum]BBM85089.1 hypothetical protein UABAM_03452 [Candidatus Uabimicrobium amorphum]